MKTIDKRDHQTFTKDLCKEFNRLTKYGNNDQFKQKWNKYKTSDFYKKLWFRDLIQCIRPDIDTLQASKCSFPEYLTWLHEDFPILSQIMKYTCTTQSLKYEFLNAEINSLLKTNVTTRNTSPSIAKLDDGSPPVTEIVQQEDFELTEERSSDSRANASQTQQILDEFMSKLNNGLETLLTDKISQFDTVLGNAKDMFSTEFSNIEQKVKQSSQSFLNMVDEEKRNFQSLLHSTNIQQPKEDNTSTYVFNVNDWVWYKHDNNSKEKAIVLSVLDEGKYVIDVQSFKHNLIVPKESLEKRGRYEEVDFNVRKTLSRPKSSANEFDDEEDLDFELQKQRSNRKQTSGQLNEKEFIYFKRGDFTLQVMDIYLAKSTTKFKCTSEDQLMMFYDTFQTRLEQYNILIRPYRDITKTDGVRVLNVENSLNHNSANIHMSRSIYNFLDDRKYEIFAQFPAAINLLDGFRKQNDGFAYLERLMESAHPKLRNPMISTRKVNKPTLRSCASIYSFMNKYIDWLEYEAQEIPPRTYSDNVKLNYIISELESINQGNYTGVVMYLMAQRDRLFCDPLHPQALPPELQFDRIVHTIIDRVSPDHREELFSISDDIESPIVNKLRENRFSPNKQRTLRTHDSTKNNNSYDKAREGIEDDIPYKRNALDTTCKACGQYGHDVPDCDFLSKMIRSKKFLDSASSESIKLTLDAYYKHQLRVRKNNRRKKKLRMKVNKLEQSEYSPEIREAAVMLCNAVLESDSSNENELEYGVSHNNEDDSTASNH